MSQNPFQGTSWFIDPDSNARRQAHEWNNSRPDDARLIRKIAEQPQADWFGDWYSDIENAVEWRITSIASSGDLPLLVAYNIPNRDCGGYSSGGASAASEYRLWIRHFAAGIGNRKAIVVLEPDALAHAGPYQPCAAFRKERCELLRDAIEVLKTNEETAVYVDAGNARWLSAHMMADLLRDAGIEQADGFALNVSNFIPNDYTLSYGWGISQHLGDKPFIVDTSRNGHGDHYGSVYNPPNKGLGERPTSLTGNALCHAFVWIKRPGESDGPYNGGPQAGTWWPEYALELCERAVF